VLHEKVLLISVDTADFPTVPPEERVTISKVGPGIWQVLLTFGFMDDPNVPEALELIDDPRLPLDVDAITFFLGRETVLATAERGMNPLREQLFALQNRSASSAARFFSLPSRAVFEVGTTIEI
jgi:KUP system potassium uptake protein